MTDEQPPRHRRTRARSNHENSGTDATPAVASGTPETLEPSAPNTRGRDPERGWRELAGNAPSQVGVSGALRARDIARPGPEDLAAADRDVVIVRRDWKPPADSPGFSPKPNRSSRTS